MICKYIQFQLAYCFSILIAAQLPTDPICHHRIWVTLLGGVRLHRYCLNVTEIEIEVHKSFTCCLTSLRFVMKRYVADMSCTLLTINRERERDEEAWEIVDRQEYATAVRVIHLDYFTSSTSRARCNDAHESCLNLNSKYQLGT